MRRLLPTAALAAAALAIAGCGSSGSNSGGSGAAGSARQAELAYVPAGSPIVLSLQTDPKSTAIRNLQQLLAHFPIVSFGEQALLTKLQQMGIDYATQVKPLLGDPITLSSAVGNTATLQSSDFLFVWMTPHPDKLGALLKKLPTGGSTHSDGATIYQTGSAAIGVKGATIVIASSVSSVEAAFQRASSGGGFSASEARQLLTGLPSSALLEAFGDLKGVLSTAKAAQARAIPWVGAIRGYGVALQATASAIDLSFRVDTGGATLTAAQLPISTSTAAPELVGTLPISVGLTNPSQAISFVLQAVRAADPSALNKVPAGGIAAIQQLQGQLTGAAAIASDGSTQTLFRAQLSNPATASSLLQSLIKLGKGPKPTALGGGFFQDRNATFGIVGDQLVIGRGTVAELRAFAAAPAAPAAGAHGPLAFRVNLLPLIQRALHSGSAGGIASTILAQLGDVTGWVAATPAALTGQASLSVH